MVTGRFAAAKDGQQVYFYSDSGYKDSATIRDGRFTCTVKTDDKWCVYFISCPAVSRAYMFPLLLTTGSVLDFDVNEALDKVVIKGDKMAKLQQGFYEGYRLATEKYNLAKKEFSAATDALKKSELKDRLTDSGNQLNAYPVSWVDKNRESPFSPAVIRLYIFKGNLQADDTLARRLYALLTPESVERNREAELLRDQFSFHADEYSNVPLEEYAPAFSILDSSGNIIRLSDYKGSYVLIDFWASWCGPCRENNPALGSLYRKYKAEGLHLLSISVDTDPGKWKRAIIKDEMHWPQGTDLKGKDGGVALQYGIIAVPIYFLISPEGKVVLKSLGGDINVVEKELKRIFDIL